MLDFRNSPPLYGAQSQRHCDCQRRANIAMRVAVLISEKHLNSPKQKSLTTGYVSRAIPQQLNNIRVLTCSVAGKIAVWTSRPSSPRVIGSAVTLLVTSGSVK